MSRQGPVSLPFYLSDHSTTPSLIGAGRLSQTPLAPQIRHEKCRGQGWLGL